MERAAKGRPKEDGPGRVIAGGETERSGSNGSR